MSKLLRLNRRGDGGSDGVRLCWRQLAVDELELQQCAREVVELLVGLPQPRLDAPAILQAGNPEARPSQSPVPLSFSEAGARFAGLAWDIDFSDPGAVRKILLTEQKDGAGSGGGAITESMSGSDGQLATEGSVPSSGEAELSLEQLERDLKSTAEAQPRAPMVINRRPGRGGRHLDPYRPGREDATAGLEAYGEVSWQGVAGGAAIGIIEFDAAGNTDIACRVSYRDVARGETLVNQLRPCLALAERHPELRPRLAILAYAMSGTREMRTPEYTPQSGKFEREDCNLLLAALEAGQIEHAIWRDGDRMARDVIPGELLIRELERNGAGLWIAGIGRRIDYKADRLSLRASMMVSAEERDSIVRRTQMGAINKGPLTGRGWANQKIYGFYRPSKNAAFVEDTEAMPWVHRAFELADTGDFLEDGGGLSTREVAARLAEEGCPFDHDALRKILEDEVYATGCFYSKLRAHPIRQDPIALTNPVPLDRFSRVQMLLSLRQGSNKRTPLGEFILNYIPTYHRACGGGDCGDDGQPDQRSRIRGAVRKRSPKARTYRHPTPCPSCRGVTWQRAELEHPIIEAVRGLAQHPEVRRQLELAAEHHVAATQPSVDPERVHELQRQLVALEARKQEITDRYSDELALGGELDMDHFKTLLDGTGAKIERLRRQIKAAESQAAKQTGDRPRTPKEQGRLEAFLEILTLDPPEDPYLRALRARLVKTVLSRVVIGEELVEGAAEGDGAAETCGADEAAEKVTVIEIWSPLVADGSDAETASQLADPLNAVGELLDQEIERRANEEPEPELKRAGDRWRGGVQTDLSPLDQKSVWTMYDQFLTKPTTREISRENAKTLGSLQWVHDRRLKTTGGYAPWRLRIRLLAGAPAAETAEAALSAVRLPSEAAPTPSSEALSAPSGQAPTPPSSEAPSPAAPAGEADETRSSND